MKIFNKKDDSLSQDPISYLNKDKNKMPFFITSSWGNKKMTDKTKNTLKRIGLISLPVFAIALGTTLGVISNNLNKDNIDSIVNVNQNVVKRRIYLLSEDNYTIPLTVTLDKKNNIYEEMLDVIDLLKLSSDVSNEYLRGYIPDETRVNSFEIKDNNLFIDFSNEFLAYQEKNEHLLFNSLIATLEEFEEVDKVNITIDGRHINDLLSSYEVKNEKTFLNNIHYSPSNMENKDLITVFYQRTYDSDNKYLVPVSLYVDVKESLNVTYANGLFKQLPSSYMLTNLSIYNSISKDQDKSDEFSLKVNKSALIDENTVNRDLYEVVMLSLDLMNIDEKVSFNIEGETLKVDGIYTEEDQEVSNIYYNEIEI